MLAAVMTNLFVTWLLLSFLPAARALAQTTPPEQGLPESGLPPQDPGFTDAPAPPSTWVEQPGFQDGEPQAAGTAHGTAGVSPGTRRSVAPETVTLESEPNLPPDYRSRSFKIHNAISSSTGLHRVVTADSGAPGTFRLSLLASFFSGTGVHCDAERPCAGSSDVDAVRSTAARLSLSATLLPFLEGSLAMHTRATSNSAGRPELLQILGDAAIGAKVFTPYEPDSVLSFGGLAELWLLNGGGSVGLDLTGTSLGLTALATADFTRRADESERLPWRAHLNAGYFVNNSSELVREIEQNRDAPVSRIERFGLGVQRVDSLRFGLGGEFVHDVVRPFVEWSVDVPVNRQGYECDTARARAAGEDCLGAGGNFATTPSRLGLGARVFPWQKHGLGLTVGVDIGTGATTSFVEETTPELPWVLHLGLGYAIDTEQPRPVIQRVIAPPRSLPPPDYYLSGVVLDSATLGPLPDAVLRFDDRALTGMVTTEDGTFRSGSLRPGSYRLSVTKEGYRSGLCAVAVPTSERGAGVTLSRRAPSRDMVSVACPLEALPRVGNVVGAVVGSEGGYPVEAASVRITDKLGRSLDLVADASGAFRFENVPPGLVRLTARAPGFLPGFIELQSAAHSDVTARLPLAKSPSPASATFTAQAIKLRKGVAFAPGSSVLPREAKAILAEVAALLFEQQRGVLIEIRGHTDDSVTEVESLALSQRRADAVREYLVLLGVDGAGLVARGYGRAQPLVPNVSEANRAKNQRVEFVVMPKRPTPPAVVPARAVVPPPPVVPPPSVVPTQP